MIIKQDDQPNSDCRPEPEGGEILGSRAGKKANFVDSYLKEGGAIAICLRCHEAILSNLCDNAMAASR